MPLKIKTAALAADDIMLSAAHIREAARHKEGRGNFVTEYDRRIQAFLFERLHEILPEANFVGEEDHADLFQEKFGSGYAFVIDPIDGTLNFISRYRPSVVSIALLKDGQPYIGVIYNPCDRVLCHAVRGRPRY